MLVPLADWCYRRRRLVVVSWIVALVGSFALAGAFGGDFKQNYLQPGSDSQAASDTLGGSFPERAGDTVQVVVHAATGVTTPAVRARAEKIFTDLADAAHVVAVTSPFSDAGATQVSADGTTAYAVVALDRTDNEFTVDEAKALVEPVLAAGDGALQVEVGGAVAALSQTAPVGSEVIGLVAAAIVLLVTFGSAVAMGLPLLTALFGLGVAVGLGGLVMRVVDVPDWAPPVAAMVGIGVGIDYALLIVTRFRERSRRRAGPSARRPDRDLHRRASGRLRRAHRRRLVARRPAHGPAGDGRVRVQRHPRGARRHGCVGHPAARPCWGSPAATSSACTCPSSARTSGRTTPRAGSGGAGSSSADPRCRPSAASSSCWRWPRRSWASASASRTPRTTRPPTPPARRTTCWPRGSARASPRRSCSPSRGRADVALQDATETIRGTLGEVDGVANGRAGRSSTPRGTPPCCGSSPPPLRRTRPRPDLVDTVRDEAVPAALAGTGLTVHVGGSVAADLDTTRGHLRAPAVLLRRRPAACRSWC